ncbi:MAG: HEAT repeat domain-containing protein [Acidobacteriota bacterium]
MSTRKKVLCILFACLTLIFAASVEAQQRQKIQVEGLIYDLEHPDAERRRQSAILLGRHEIRQAVPALIRTTEDEDESVRLESVRALVQINDTRALQAYIRLTGDHRKAVRSKAVEGIVNVHVVKESGFSSGVSRVVQFVNPLSDDYNPLVVESYVPVSQDAIAALANLLSSSDRGTREEATVALGILRAHSALPAMQEALARETSDRVKVELIRAIYKIGDPAGGETLIPFILDSDKKVHDEAIFALGRLGVKEAVPQLKELYDSGVAESRTILGIVPVSGKDDLQRKVFEALAYIGDSQCADLFVSGLEDERDFYRRYGAEGLGRIGDQSYTTEVARKYLRESSGSVKLAMGFALFRLGREEHLVEMIDHVDKEQVFHYLLELNSQDIEKLYPHLESEMHTTRVSLLEIVGLRGSQSALPIVEEMAKHPNPDISASANLAVRRLRGREAGSEVQNSSETRNLQFDIQSSDIQVPAS